MPLDPDHADVLDAEFAIDQLDPIAVGGELDRVEAIPAFEPGIPRLLARLDPTEEGGEGLV
jgi:hypothetical protein